MSSEFLIPKSWNRAFKCLQDDAKFGVIRNLSGAVRWPTNVEDDEEVSTEEDADEDGEDEGPSLTSAARLDGSSPAFS